MTRPRHSPWHGGTGCVIFYSLPWMGLELLDTARTVAEFDLPGRVLGLWWGNIMREDTAGAADRLSMGRCIRVSGQTHAVAAELGKPAS
jgi:hypothetical protein